MPARMRRPIESGTMNADIAARLDDVADLLREQDASPFRVQAYRRGAQTVRSLDEPVGQIFHRDGLDGLDRLPGIGPVIARAIRDMVLTGEYPMLARLRGERDPARVLETVPGIGPALARRLRDERGIQSLEELEVAAHDGSLATVDGFGEKRIREIVESLATRLGTRHRRPPTADPLPPLHELLDVDREYREKGAAGRLRMIAPRRLNPEHRAWLPILHTERDGRHYTALFSNTATAHRLGRTNDWVVLYYDGRNGERQCTVVTEHQGPLAGRRVVRGREREAPAGSQSSPRPALARSSAVTAP